MPPPPPVCISSQIKNKISYYPLTFGIFSRLFKNNYQLKMINLPQNISIVLSLCESCLIGNSLVFHCSILTFSTFVMYLTAQGFVAFVLKIESTVEGTQLCNSQALAKVPSSLFCNWGYRLNHEWRSTWFYCRNTLLVKQQHFRIMYKINELVLQNHSPW